MLTEKKLAEIEAAASVSSDGEKLVQSVYMHLPVQDRVFMAHAKEDVLALVETVRELRRVLRAVAPFVLEEELVAVPKDEWPDDVQVGLSFRDYHGKEYITRPDVEKIIVLCLGDEHA
jgi:hypothetical protein